MKKIFGFWFGLGCLMFILLVNLIILVLPVALFGSLAYGIVKLLQ